MLEETGAPYELVRLNISADADRERIAAVNPMGKVPALEDGAAKFGETAAILAYLADKFPAARLAPAVDAPERGRYLQWLIFPAAVMEPAAMERLNKTQERPTQAGRGSYDRMMSAMDGALAPGRNLFGDRLTAADLYCASSLKFMMTFGMVEKRPNFKDYDARAEARPAFQQASAIEAAG
jgi:glutathione S-transferase